MWPRILELMIALWLAASPWILSSAGGSQPHSWTELLFASGFIALNLLAFRWTRCHLHLASLALALLFISFSYLKDKNSALVVSDLLTGLILAMLAILPNNINQPPLTWQKLLHSDTQKIK